MNKYFLYLAILCFSVNSFADHQKIAKSIEKIVNQYHHATANDFSSEVLDIVSSPMKAIGDFNRDNRQDEAYYLINNKGSVLYIVLVVSHGNSYQTYCLKRTDYNPSKKIENYINTVRDKDAKRDYLYLESPEGTTIIYSFEKNLLKKEDMRLKTKETITPGRCLN